MFTVPDIDGRIGLIVDSLYTNFYLEANLGEPEVGRRVIEVKQFSDKQCQFNWIVPKLSRRDMSIFFRTDNNLTQNIASVGISGTSSATIHRGNLCTSSTLHYVSWLESIGVL